MAKQWTLTEDSFETLLDWLAPDRETAGQRYESIRRRLIKIFLARGCYHDAEALTDETINRVARKIPEIAENYRSENTANYFYGVANKLYLEWRRQKSAAIELDLAAAAAQISPTQNLDEPQNDLINECLKKCLSVLNEDEQKLILRYYGGEKASANRQKLAAEHNLSINNLRVRAHRVRERVERCLRACLSGNNSPRL